MSLDYNLTKIKGYGKLCYGKHVMEDLTHEIIFETMYVDVGSLKTDADCELFWRRHVERTVVYNLKTSLTLANVYAHKGLETNVKTSTTAQWRKRLYQGIERGSLAILEREPSYMLRHAKKEA